MGIGWVRKCLIGLVVVAGAAVLPTLSGTAAAATCPAVDSTHFVVTTSADTGAGSLRVAIADASAAGARSAICIESSVRSIDLASSLHATDAADELDIVGNGATIAGDGTFGLFEFDGPVAIDDLVMTGGHAASGGAINAHEGLDLTNSVLQGNTADIDGGAVRVSSNLTSTATRYTDNVAGGKGGGIAGSKQVFVFGGDFSTNTAHAGGAIESPDYVSASTATFVGNHAVNGGAISAGQVSAFSTTFDHNSAIGWGGATFAGTSGFVGDTFVGNSAIEGGAIWASDLSVVNSTFVDNIATLWSGGAAFAIAISVAYSTFDGNRAERAGSVFEATGLRYSHIFGSVFGAPADATALCAGAFASLGYNDADESANSCGLTAVGDSSLDTNDAALSELADHGGPTATELPGSRLLDRIPNDACASDQNTIPFDSSVDQRGFPRPEQVGGACDIGAVEIQLVPADAPATGAVSASPHFTG